MTRGGPVLVAEIGGTTMRAARYDGDLQDRRTGPTPNNFGEGRDQEDVLDALLDLCTGILPPDAANHVVALAYPGPLDDKGVVLAAPTVVGRAEPFDLGAAAARRWPDAKVVILNDLTAAGYRYVAAGRRDFAIITVGSGIGHKVFLDGEPLAGQRGRGGEIGHLRVDFETDALPCDCGGFGHIGGLASGRGVIELVRRRTGRSLSGPEVVTAYLDRASAGHDDVRECVELGLRYLGLALAAIHVDTGVEQFVVQGGFARAMGQAWLDSVARAAAEACWSIGQHWPEMVRLGAPDDDSALLGAGWFAVGPGR